MKKGKGDIKAQKARWRERHRSEITKENRELLPNIDWQKFIDYFDSQSLNYSTRKEMADELHISEDSIYAYLAGRRKPSSEFFSRLAYLENVPYKKFIKRFKK